MTPSSEKTISIGHIDSRINTPVACLILLFLSSIFLLNQGLIDGHDLEYFIFRLKGVAAGLANGTFPVRIQTSQINGYGYPVGVMFCDILYYPAAALSLVGLSLENCYRLVILTVNVLTIGLGMYSFAKLTGSKTYGLFATALYTLSYYRLENITLRADIGEALGAAFLPLLLLACISIFNNKRNLANEPVELKVPDWVIYAIAFSGIICSNIPLTVMTIVFQGIGFIIAMVFASNASRKRLILALVKGVALTVCITAFYAIPLIDYYINADLAVTSGLLNTGTKAYAAEMAVNPSQLFSVFQEMSGSSTQYQYLGMPTTIGAGLLVATFVAIMRPKNKAHNKALIIMLVLAAVALFMASSLFPWDTDAPVIGTIVGFLAKIQFPWRFICFATLFLVIYCAAALREFEGVIRNGVRILMALILVIASLEASFGISSFVRANLTKSADSILEQYDGIFDAQFIPSGTFKSRPDFLVDEPTVTTSAINIETYEKSGTAVSLNVYVNGAGEVVLPLLSYPYYSASSSNADVGAELTANSEGLLILEIEGNGQSDIQVQFKEPLHWRISEIVSLVSVLITCVFAVKYFMAGGNRRSKANLSYRKRLR